jgi:hypothetical protein
MNRIEQIKAKYDEDSKTIFLTIEESDKTVHIEATVRATGMFKFSYHHPELDNAESYQGLLDNSKVHIYPFLGKGVISNQPITLETEINQSLF